MTIDAKYLIIMQMIILASSEEQSISDLYIYEIFFCPFVHGYSTENSTPI